MIGLALLFLLVFVLVGGSRLRAGVQGVAGLWRPTTGLLSVAAMMAAAVLAIREDWGLALLMAALAGGLALGARRRASSPPRTGSASMSSKEASAILGVPHGADPSAVDAAYRRLIRFAHPDQGGTEGLAAQLNAARAALRGR